MFPFLGSTQLRVLCAFASIVLLATVLVTCITTSEDSSINEQNASGSHWLEPFTVIKDSWESLPKPVELVCNTQFFSWMGWFPFLFYSSSWASNLDESRGGDVREGSFALMLFSIISVVAGFVIPVIQVWMDYPLAKIWAVSLWGFAIATLSSLFISFESYPTCIIASLGICWGKTDLCSN